MISPPLSKWSFRILFWILPAGKEGFLKDQVAKGEGRMPPYESLLSPEEREALALYIHLLPIPGDCPLPDRPVHWRQNCSYKRRARTKSDLPERQVFFKNRRSRKARHGDPNGSGAAAGAVNF